MIGTEVLKALGFMALCVVMYVGAVTISLWVKVAVTLLVCAVATVGVLVVLIACVVIVSDLMDKEE